MRDHLYLLSPVNRRDHQGALGDRMPPFRSLIILCVASVAGTQCCGKSGKLSYRLDSQDQELQAKLHLILAADC